MFHVRSGGWSYCKKRPFMKLFSTIISSWREYNGSKTSSSTQETSNMSGGLLWKGMGRTRMKPLCVRNGSNELKINTDLCLSSPDERKASVFYRPNTALTQGRQPFWTWSQRQAVAQSPALNSTPPLTRALSDTIQWLHPAFPLFGG